MLPRIAHADVPDIRGLGIEPSGYLCVGQSVLTKASDLDDIVVSEFGEVRCLASMWRLPFEFAPRMSMVVLASQIFQVARHIVRAATIAVIDLITLRASADKHHGDETMHHEFTLHMVAGGQPDTVITAAVWVRLQDVIAQTADAALVADFVKPFVSVDGFPRLLHGDIVTPYNMRERTA